MVATVPLAMYEALALRYDALVRECLALKRDGFVAPEPMRKAATLPELPESVQAAIASVTEPNTALYAHLVDEAWRMTRAGESEAVIAQRIEDGEPAEL